MASSGVHTTVSNNRGLINFPAALRHRWGIEAGGVVAFVDLGDAALVFPGGIDRASAELKRVLSQRHEEGRAAIADPDLADQR